MPTKSPRIRGRLGVLVRRVHLAHSPLCVECLKAGRTTLATEVDHIVPLCRGGRESRDPFDNRQALCSACHAAKTSTDLGRRVIGLDGWPVEGDDGRGGSSRIVPDGSDTVRSKGRAAKSVVPDSRGRV